MEIYDTSRKHCSFVPNCNMMCLFVKAPEVQMFNTPENGAQERTAALSYMFSSLILSSIFLNSAFLLFFLVIVFPLENIATSTTKPNRITIQSLPFGCFVYVHIRR